jgi:hypothetical protein
VSLENEHPILKELAKVQYDLSVMKTRVAGITREVAALNLPAPWKRRCPHCELELRSTTALAEHLYHQHDGPLPPHWDDAEKLAKAPEE